MNKNMEIKFTKEQYEKLIKIAYLGNWMINSIHSDADEDKQHDEFNEIEQYIFSFAKDIGFEKYVEFDKKFNRFFPTRELEEDHEMQQGIEDYDNEAFWSELSNRLGERDFFKKYHREDIRKMDRKEHFLKLQECIIPYEEEFFENGIENIELKK